MARHGEGSVSITKNYKILLEKEPIPRGRVYIYETALRLKASDSPETRGIEMASEVCYSESALTFPSPRKASPSAT